MLLKEEQSNNLEGIKVARDAPLIIYLFFADDALVFFKTDPSSCKIVKGVLDDVCQASGEMVNLQKSFIILSHNVPSCIKAIFRASLGVKPKSEFGTYLGSPVVFSSSKVRDFLF